MSFAAGAGDESNCRIPAMNGILTAHNIFLALFLSTAIFVQLRGRVHHKLDDEFPDARENARQLFEFVRSRC